MPSTCMKFSTFMLIRTLAFGLIFFYRDLFHVWFGMIVEPGVQELKLKIIQTEHVDQIEMSVDDGS